MSPTTWRLMTLSAMVSSVRGWHRPPIASRGVTAAAPARRRCSTQLSKAGSGSGRQAPRLYVSESSLLEGAVVGLSAAQRRYLGTVMRLQVGDSVNVFNGRDGEWRAQIHQLDRKHCELRMESLLRQQPSSSTSGRPALIFAVLKGARLPTLIEKATELGVADLQPCLTDRCVARDLNCDRLMGIAAEAAEQCGRLSVPTVHPPRPLAELLQTWPERGLGSLCACDERGEAPSLARMAYSTGGAQIGGLLIGPEGGFSPREFALMDDADWVRPVSLGDNILRAETAAIAALAVLACCHAPSEQ